jgi:hypothetical protein
MSDVLYPDSRDAGSVIAALSSESRSEESELRIEWL